MDASLFWVVNYYDGPLEGLAQDAQGHLLWFRIDAVDEGHWDLYRLTAEELERLLQDKHNFETMVSSRWSYDVPAEQRTVQDKASQQAYYTQQRPLAERQAFYDQICQPHRKAGDLERWI